MALTIQQFEAKLANAVATGALAQSLMVASTGLALHGQRRAVQFASVEPGRPHGLGVVTGLLTSTLGGEALSVSGGVNISISSGNAQRGGAPYAPKHELGLGVRPRPFLGPALDEVVDKADGVISAELARMFEGLTA